MEKQELCIFYISISISKNHQNEGNVYITFKWDKSDLDFIFLNDYVKGYKTSINKIVSVSYYANTALKPKLLYPLNFRILI